jgi:hypothetical protein
MTWRITYTTTAGGEETVTLGQDWCEAASLDPDAIDEGPPEAAAWHLALTLAAAGDTDPDLIRIEQT